MERQSQSGLFKRFFKGQKGSIAIMAAFSFSALSILSGIATDLIRYHYVKSRLVIAAEAAVLAAVRFGGSKTFGQTIFYANISSVASMLTNTKIAFGNESYNFSQLGMSATVTGNVDLLFGKLIKMPSLSINMKTQGEYTPLGQDYKPLPYPGVSYYTNLPDFTKNGIELSKIHNMRVPQLKLAERTLVSIKFIDASGPFNNSIGVLRIKDTSRRTDEMTYPQIIFSHTQGADMNAAKGSSKIVGTFVKDTELVFFVAINAFNLNNFTNPSVPNFVKTASIGEDYYTRNNGSLFFVSCDTIDCTTTTWDHVNPYTGLIPSFDDPGYRYLMYSSIGTIELFYYFQPMLYPQYNDIFYSRESTKMKYIQQQFIAYGNNSGWIRMGVEDVNIVNLPPVATKHFKQLIFDVELGTDFTNANFNRGYAYLGQPQ